MYVIFILNNHLNKSKFVSFIYMKYDSISIVFKQSFISFLSSQKWAFIYLRNYIEISIQG